MGIGTTAAVVGGSLAGAGIGAGASISAANTQADAAKSAAQLQADEAQKSLDFQKQEWNTQQANEKPFLQAGTKAVGELSDLTSTPGQGLLAGYDQTFSAPTLAQAEQEPGYQFSLQQGTDALEKGAAARGDLLSGNEGVALQQYGQQLGQNNYQNVYNRALSTYDTNFNVFNQNQTNEYNRLANESGMGQTTAAQLGSQGQAAASNVGNINLTTGAQQGQDLQNAAAATASGYVGAGNAVGGALSNLSALPLYSQMLAQQNGAINSPLNVPDSMQYGL